LATAASRLRTNVMSSGTVTILQIERIPRSLCIVGAWVVGCEYAAICAVMGCKVTLVNSQKVILRFLDRKIASALLEHMQELGIEIMNETQIQTAAVVQKKGQTVVHAQREDKGQTKLTPKNQRLALGSLRKHCKFSEIRSWA
jgi:pyruvate/2-oxoglutarate dehydrogenase complex dihydrolipoamide dehydrogenase (E3) component